MRLRGEWFDFLRLNVSWVSWWLSTGPAQNEKIVTYCGIQCGSLRISLAVDFRLPRLALCACQTSAREDGPMEELAELQIKVLLTRICFAARCSGNQRDQTLVIPQSVDRLSSYSYSMHFYAYIIYIALAYCVEKSILRVSCRCSHAVNSVWTFSRKKPDWRSSFRTARSCKLNDIYYILYYIILYYIMLYYILVYCIILYYIVLYYSIYLYIYLYIFIYLYIYLYALLQYAPELCFHLGYGLSGSV